jgi:2-succinyl-6-hydroxy-2,4-cyclohexadiene-1-carboxylate synthase
MPLLSYDRQGSGPTLVWLHGFTQTRSSAHQFRSILAGTNELLTLDLPGHGAAAEVRATLEETADLLAKVLPEEPLALGGYSFGARVALHVALRHPGRIGRLVILGASRGIEDPAERMARRRRDEQLANRMEEIGAKAFLDEWLAQPMFASLPTDATERAARSFNARGLAASLRLSGTGTQEWLEPRLHEITIPTLALAGSNDAKFSIEAAAIAAGVAHGSCVLIEGAGHAAHLEQPQASAQAVNSFLISG